MNRFRFKRQSVATSIPPQIGCPANLELSCSSSIFHWKPHHAVGFLLTKVLNWKATTIDPPPKNRPRLSWKSGKVIYFERKPTWYDWSWFDSKPTVEHDAQHDVPLVSQTVPHYSSHHIPSLPALCRMLQRRHQRPLRVLHRGTRVGDCKQWKEKQLFMIHHLSIFHPFIHLSSHHLSIFSVKIHLWLDLLHGYPWISAVLHGNLLHHRLHGARLHGASNQLEKKHRPVISSEF